MAARALTELDVAALGVTGLTGATSASRYAGAIASGTAPSSGTFSTGDWMIVQAGGITVCTAGGTPGTWAADALAAATLQKASNLSDVASAAAARANLGALAANQLGPADHGVIGWSVNPYNIRTSDITAMTAGTLYVVKIPVPAAATITSIGYYVVQAGTSLTSSQNFAALFGPTGTWLASTADQTANFGSTATHTAALSSAQAVAAGYVYAGFYSNGTGTAVALAKGDSGSLSNFNLSSANALFATANTGLTTAMPGSLGTLTALSAALWAAVL